MMSMCEEVGGEGVRRYKLWEYRQYGAGVAKEFPDAWEKMCCGIGGRWEERAQNSHPKVGEARMWGTNLRRDKINLRDVWAGGQHNKRV
jgi:hypothetical protein